MGFVLLPLAVLSFFLGIFAAERTRTQDILPSAIVIQAAASGQIFVAYRNAVAVYLQNNPTFVGTVSSAALTAQGNSFSAGFLVSTSNAITATGVAGRVITCYTASTTGTLQAAREATNNDASLGVATGTNWTSADFGSTATPLAAPVPNGAVVSVVQIGS